MIPALLTGFLTAIPFLFYGRIPIVIWVSLVPLILSIQNKTRRGAFGRGYLAGFVFNGLSLYWLGTLSYWAGGFGFLGQMALIAYLALYWGVFALVANIVMKRCRLPIYLLLPPLWILLEYAVSRLFTGFGWTLLGYSQGILPDFADYRVSVMNNHNLILQWASIGGVFIVSFWIVLVNSLVVVALSSHKRTVRRVLGHMAAALIALAIVNYGGSLLFTSSGGEDEISQERLDTNSIRVAVVQPDLSLREKWRKESRWEKQRRERRRSDGRRIDKEPNIPYVLQRHLDESEAAIRKATRKKSPPTDLMIWPEAAIVSNPPVSFEKDSRTREELRKFAVAHNLYLLVGAMYLREVESVNNEDEGKRKIPQTESMNSAYLLAPEGEILGRYDKVHLTPFGEYTPLQKYMKAFPAISFTGGGMKPGEAIHPLQFKDKNLGILICFETVFPEISRELRQQGADVLVTMTNLAWFGASAATRQELALSVFRAVENRMNLVRAGNIGMTCFVDPWGRIRGYIRPGGGMSFSSGSGAETVLAEAGSSFYSRHGDLFVWACGISFIVMFLFGIFRNLAAGPDE